ncbi:MAG: oligosaccharide flippase family protein [Candidatus Bathyarchaeota archaeon]|nr:oligosaccharide flippase family protein [Candidatus Bathyarchaeota archaeon]
MVKKSARGSLILLAGQVVSNVILAVGILIVAGSLGPSPFGALAAAQAPIGIAMILQNLGVDAALIKHLAQYSHEERKGYNKVLIEAGVLLKIAVSLVLTCLTFYGAGFIAMLLNNPAIEIPLKYLSFSLIPHAILSTTYAITIGYERMEFRSYIQVIYSTLKSIVAPVLVLQGYGIIGAIFGDLGPGMFSAILGLFFITIIYKKEKDVPRPISLVEGMKMLLSYGFPLYLASIIGGVLPHISTSLLTRWTTDEVTGNWSATLRFSVLLAFVTLPISTAIFPLFSKLEDSLQELELVYQSSVKYATLFAFPITVAIMALSDQIIEVLLRGQYVLAPYYLRLYMMTFFFIGLGSTSNVPLLNSQKRTKETFNVTLIRFLVSVPSSFFLIPRYGAVGLIATLFLNALSGNLYALYAIKRSFGFLPDLLASFKQFLAAIISYLVTVYLTSFLEINPWVEIFLGGAVLVLVYLACILVLKALSPRDFDNLDTICSAFGPLAPVLHRVLVFIRSFS